MAQLVSMRQRIKAVETIKKVTHAMRLISMSAHTRLRHKKMNLQRYKEAFQELWHRVAHRIHVEKPSKQITMPEHLVILVSAQKGLCGTFNASLFKFFEHEHIATENTHYIGIGKYAIDYLTNHYQTLLAAYDNFSAAYFVTIAQAVTQIIIQNPDRFTSVTVYCNYQKSFFLQKARKNIIYPLQEMVEPQNLRQVPTIDYLFEQSPEELSATIRQLMLVVSLEELLFDSLLAEQAARFLSMDASTRNADKLLVAMKLEYNKTRQAAITRELTELASSY